MPAVAAVGTGSTAGREGRMISSKYEYILDVKCPAASQESESEKGSDRGQISKSSEVNMCVCEDRLKIF